MGEDKISLGYVVGLDYADANLSAHDVLQQFKTHPFIREILEGGKRLAWGAKTIPGGGLYGLPSRLHVPGAVLVGRQRRLRGHGGPEGRPTTRSTPGILAAEAIYEALKAGKATSPAGLWGYTRRIRDSAIWKELWKVRNIRPAFQKSFLYGGMVHGMATGSLGHAPRKRVKAKTDIREPIFLSGDRAASYPKPDGQLHLRQALERLRQRQRDPRRPAQPHPPPAPRPRGARDRLGAHVPGAGLRDRRGRAAERHRHGQGQPVQLRAVRGDHGQGRPADPARGRQRARVHRSPEHPRSPTPPPGACWAGSRPTPTGCATCSTGRRRDRTTWRPPATPPCALT